MLKRIVSGIILTLVLMGIFVLTFNIQPAKATPATIIVPDDYPTIQEAVNAASPGDTVFVRNGTYYENVVVNKTISLFGQDAESTILDGNATSDCVNIAADYVKISGFTIRNGGSRPYTAYASIRLFSSRNIILKNILIGSWCGVYMEHYSDYNLIANNTIMENLNGISGEMWHNTKIISNTIKNNLMGIWIGPYSQNNIISFNNITGHWSEGIMMMQSSNNTFEGNNVIDNNQGITIGFQKGFSSGNKFFHNTIANRGKQVELGQGESEPIIWDNGYPSGGNYWSDYTGVDVKSGPAQDLPGSDGIGDTPYIIDANNIDRYPLMNPFGTPPPQSYTLRITATVGKTTTPAPGTYSYTVNSSVQVTAIPEAGYSFDHWELDSINTGSTNTYTVLMSQNHTLKAIFSNVKPSVPVGGYSIPIQGQTTDNTVAPYIILTTILAITLTATKRKTKRAK